MSIVSSLLKARFGVPEVNLMKNPITKKIFGDLQNKELEKIIKELPSETLKSMSKSSKKPLVSLSPSISKLISEVDLSFLSFDQEVPKKDSKFSTLTIFSVVFFSLLSGSPQQLLSRVVINREVKS